MNIIENNNSSSLSQLLFDRGLHYGDGVFETIAVKFGIAELLDEHINRLIKSCERLQLADVDFLKIKRDINHKVENIEKGIIKLIVTRGCGGRGYAIPEQTLTNYMILQYPWPDYSPEMWDKGIAIKRCNLILGKQPVLAGIKHLNRLENVIARMELKDTEFQEGILCDSEQNVIEATSSNIFIVTKNKIITPKLDNCGVSGVMRDRVIKKSQEIHFTISIQDIPYKVLLDADEIFLTNSIIGIWPVTKFNERIYSNLPVTRKLMSLLKIHYHE